MSRLLVLVCWMVFGLTACDGGDPTCSEEVPCDFGEMCVLGECITAECVTSAQCPMETHCVERACTDGCETDNDCYAGDYCNTEEGTCEAAACEETSVDCDYREFCNPATGDCYDAGNRYCMPCSDDSDCGGDNICYGNYCAVSCDDGQACPSGFECYEFSDEFGQVAGYWCFTYCGYYEDWEGGEAPEPPPTPSDCLQPPQLESEASP